MASKNKRAKRKKAAGGRQTDINGKGSTAAERSEARAAEEGVENSVDERDPTPSEGATQRDEGSDETTPKEGEKKADGKKPKKNKK